MEMLVLDIIADLVARSKSPAVALFWTAFVGTLVWLPSLGGVVSRYRWGQSVAHFVTFLGFASLSQLAAEPFVRLALQGGGLNFHWRSSVYLLHLIALGSLALWFWLHALETEREDSEGNASEILRDLARKDWILIARLTLWLTLSLMPVVEWS